MTLDPAAPLTGTVTSDGTSGIEGIVVVAYAWDDADKSWHYASEAVSDSSGRYSLRGLAPGVGYKIRFVGNGAFLEQYFNGAQSLETATEVMAPGNLPRVTLDPDPRITPTLTLSASPATVTAGQTVTLTATISEGATGWVWFDADDDYLGEAEIADGVATITTSALTVGTHGFQASYGGDDAHRGAYATTSVTVTSASTTPPTDPPVVTPPVVTPPVVTPPVVTPPVVTPPVVTPPVGTPAAPTAVTLSRPTWSKSSQTYGHKSVVRVTTVVTGATSGTVTFRSAGKVLGTAAIVAGKASLALPARQGIGAYVVTATVDATATTAAATSPASAKFTVVKAKLAKKSKVTGKTFKKNAKPKITVTVGKLNTGAYATGKVKIYVGKKVVRTVTVTSKNKGKITVALPKKYAKAVKVKATYVGNATTASDTSKVATVKVR